MRVLALGGCGGMGKIAVETAVAYSEITEIIVADRDLGAAERFAANFDERVTAIQVDAFDSTALDMLMLSCDVVMATIGPYYVFGNLVLESAIRSKTHYIDICDDPEPTLSMLKLHEQAKLAGITAIIGAGASPGVSNMLALKAMELLESTEQLYTLWGAGGPINESTGDVDYKNEKGEPSAATVHLIQQITGEIDVVENGKLCAGRPLTKIKLHYPGIGIDTCLSVGHPEPITFSHYYPNIRTSYNMTNMPEYLNHVAINAAKNVRPGNKDDIYKAATTMANSMSDDGISFMNIIRYFYFLLKDKSRTFFPSMAALAIGKDKSSGKRVSVGAHLEADMKTDDMAHSTCVPTAIVLRMLARGDIQQRGVLAPEACIDPDKFFDELIPYMNIKRGFSSSNCLRVVKDNKVIAEKLN
ncbi:MAG: lysine 6-dehydrogenase [Porticoccaceae bacterium]|jgi:lysine 6-dehydrogenase